MAHIARMARDAIEEWLNDYDGYRGTIVFTDENAERARSSPMVPLAPAETTRQEPSMESFLETDRLLLRRFTPHDVDNLVELDSDPEVMRFINGGRPTPREEIEDDVLPAFLAYYERFASYGFWAAEEKATGEFLGWFHFRPAKGAPPGEIELGYRLRKAAWGKGYATEGSRALIEKGFTDLRVERVVANTMVVNVASRHVMEKAGLKFVRIFYQEWPDKIEGDEEGDVEYALLRSDWERRT